MPKANKAQLKPRTAAEFRALKRAKINLETAPVQWQELERFFAQGRLIAVDVSLDLVAVAQAVADDDLDKISDYQQGGLVGAVSTEQARIWQQANALLWAVVVRPLVLVQHKT